MTMVKVNHQRADLFVKRQNLKRNTKAFHLITYTLSSKLHCPCSSYEISENRCWISIPGSMPMLKLQIMLYGSVFASFLYTNNIVRGRCMAMRSVTYLTERPALKVKLSANAMQQHVGPESESTSLSCSSEPSSKSSRPELISLLQFPAQRTQGVCTYVIVTHETMARSPTCVISEHVPVTISAAGVPLVSGRQLNGRRWSGTWLALSVVVKVVGYVTVRALKKKTRHLFVNANV